ncbi:MAG: phosphate ABC transporter permease subunit PstC [Acidobacteria bacterium]|nr:phosphate ABC transporter permease subunit PstC [Acidobacteriota bacterium]MBI3662657.1 phosphate ABC transporter permease subunit PstC [Acidobacteriota bacterium]
MSTPAATLSAPAGNLSRRRLIDGLVSRAINLAALVSISLIILIFAFVGKEALPIFTNAEVHKEVTVGRMVLPQNYGTAETPLPYVWQPVGEVPKYSLLPLFLGTLKVTIAAMLFATPLAILAALYTTEFAPRWLREIVKPVIELLAGIPSVVLGFFALMVLASSLQDAFGFDFRLNAVNAGIALGFTVLPVVYTVSEDALAAVPKAYRNASLALGATRWQTAWKIVLPAALPGVFAACVLGFGRAMGETMIVLMASGNAAITSWSFSESVRTLSASIAAELGEVVQGSAHWHVLFFLGALLFVFTFVLNWLGTQMVGRLRRRLTGA